MPKRNKINTILNEFRVAWNKKDLNEFSTFVDSEVINISPALKIGIVPIKAKSTNGRHHFLKATKEIWEQFDTYMDPMEITNISDEGDGTVVELLTHYPVMDITDINEIYLDKDFKMTKFVHHKITKYRAVENKAPFGSLILQGLKNKMKKVFK